MQLILPDRQVRRENLRTLKKRVKIFIIRSQIRCGRHYRKYHEPSTHQQLFEISKEVEVKLVDLKKFQRFTKRNPDFTVEDYWRVQTHILEKYGEEEEEEAEAEAESDHNNSTTHFKVSRQDEVNDKENFYVGNRGGTAFKSSQEATTWGLFREFCEAKETNKITVEEFIVMKEDERTLEKLNDYLCGTTNLSEYSTLHEDPEEALETVNKKKIFSEPGPTPFVLLSLDNPNYENFEERKPICSESNCIELFGDYIERIPLHSYEQYKEGRRVSFHPQAICLHYPPEDPMNEFGDYLIPEILRKSWKSSKSALKPKPASNNVFRLVWTMAAGAAANYFTESNGKSLDLLHLLEGHTKDKECNENKDWEETLSTENALSNRLNQIDGLKLVKRDVDW